LYHDIPSAFQDKKKLAEMSGCHYTNQVGLDDWASIDGKYQLVCID
jgi:hypothetical protein